MTSGADRTVDYRFRRMLDRGEWIVSVELDPPPGLSAEGRLAVAAALREAGVDCIDVGDSPLASVRMSPLSFACAREPRRRLSRRNHRSPVVAAAETESLQRSSDASRGHHDQPGM